MDFLKTTILGGLVFLVPLVVLVVVLGEAIQVMHLVADPMASFLPVESIRGVALANLLAAAIVVVVCFAAGLLARTAIAQRVVGAADSALLRGFPGYALLKGFASSLSPEERDALKPVLVAMGSTSRLGLESERVGKDGVVVYFPGSPNAWSGIVQIVPASEVTTLDVPMMDVIQIAEQMGRGSKQALIDVGG